MSRRRSQVSELRSLVADLVNQFAYEGTHNGVPIRTTGGLRDLEEAFDAMRLPDPCPRTEWQGRLAAFVAEVKYSSAWLEKERRRLMRQVQ